MKNNRNITYRCLSWIFAGIFMVGLLFPASGFIKALAAGQEIPLFPDLVYGRPLTEAEIAAEKALEPSVFTYKPLPEEANIESIEGKYDLPNRSLALEAKYDGRNEVPEVRDQNPYGTCWAFSAITSSEASMLKKYGKNPADVDLSELHLAYFMYHPVQDPLGNITGDVTYNVGNNFLMQGGNSVYTKWKLLSWTGAVEESKVPYSSADPDLSLSADLSMGSDISVHVQSVYEIAKSDRNIIKSLIKEYGSIGISYYHDSRYYNYDTKAMFNNEHTTTNHAVAVVGWDDNYAKDNFSPEKPSSNGAWLVRNSWGNEWGDKGYFWISYEDTSISDTFFLYVAEPSDNYDNNYQYDGGVFTINKTSKNVNMAGANVFTAKGKEKLQAVGFYSGAGINYKIQIYDLTDSATGMPTDGTPLLMSPQTGKIPYKGFHTINLTNAVELSPNQKFSVVLSLSAADSAIMYFDISRSGGWIKSECVANKGESFYASDGLRWVDAGENWGYNARIKAYTTNNCMNPITGITLSPGDNLVLSKGETKQIIASADPAVHDDAIIWISSDPGVAKVDQSGKVTGVTNGAATITARARTGQGIASCPVTVSMKQPVVSIKMDKPSMLLLIGNEKLLTAIPEPLASDDSVVWSSSNSQIAGVTDAGDFKANVYGNTEGTAVITATTSGGKSAQCTVTVVKSLKQEETVQFGEFPKTLKKDFIYTVKLDETVTKYSPVQVLYKVNSQNVTLKPLDNMGLSGCTIEINNVTSSKNKGEKLELKTTVVYKDSKGKDKCKLIKKKAVMVTPVRNVLILSGAVNAETKTKISLEYLFNDGDEENKPTNQKLKWMITDKDGNVSKDGKKVASVSGKGVISPKGPGVTYVTAAAAESYDKKTKSYGVFSTIRVTCPRVFTVKFAPETNVNLKPKEVLDLKKQLILDPVNPFNLAKMKMNWTSSNKSVASVSSKGIVKAGKSAGTAEIKVEAAGGVPKGDQVPAATITIHVGLPEQPLG